MKKVLNVRRDFSLAKALRIKLLLLIASAVLVTGNAWSQTLEEIVVVAQKRQESAQDVPIALSAFTGDDLAATGAVELKDISKQAPGLVLSLIHI